MDFEAFDERGRAPSEQLGLRFAPTLLSEETRAQDSPCSELAAQMSSYGFDCRQLEYLTGFAPMVECVYRDSAMAAGVPDRFANETVVLSAHFDSRGSFGLPTAPGADDDASGTSLVLAVARTIWQHRLRFSRKLGASFGPGPPLLRSPSPAF